AIGRILDYVDDPNGDGDHSDSIARDTLVIFFSDNGGPAGSTSNQPLRGAKGMFYEGGIRVPLIARLPGVIAPGSVSEAAVHEVDFYPTFAAFARAKLPDAKQHMLDGESFAGILRGQKKRLDRQAIYWHFPGYLDTRAVPCSTIIKDRGGKRYKL